MRRARPVLGSTSQTFSLFQQPSLWLSASQGFSQGSARSLSYLSRRPDNSSDLSVTVVHFPVASVPRSRFLATTPKEEKAEEKEKSIEGSTPQVTPQAEEAKIEGIIGISFPFSSNLTLFIANAVAKSQFGSNLTKFIKVFLLRFVQNSEFFRL